MIHKKKYRNADEGIIPAVGVEPVKEESKVWGVFDKIFGVTSDLGDVYAKYRTDPGGLPNPYAPQVQLAQQRKSQAPVLIIGGVLIVGVIGYAIYKSSKK